jgi:hypothetical protein
MDKLTRYKKNQIKKRYSSLRSILKVTNILKNSDFQRDYVRILCYKAYINGNNCIKLLKRLPQQKYITNTDVCNID